MPRGRKACGAGGKEGKTTGKQGEPETQEEDKTQSDLGDENEGAASIEK